MTVWVKPVHHFIFDDWRVKDRQLWMRNVCAHTRFSIGGGRLSPHQQL